VDKARFWSTQARDPGLSYEHSELGFNYRLSNVLAGIGRGQLAVLEERVAARRAHAFAYADALAPLGGFTLMPEMPWGRHTYWLSVFAMDEAALGIERDALVRALGAEDIESRPVWKPMHLQKFYADAPRVGGSKAEALYRAGLCLPSSSFLGPDDRARVVDAIGRAVRRPG
jgi:pyridoxal phosphate-dependent aminotransferase EpsN